MAAESGGPFTNEGEIVFSGAGTTLGETSQTNIPNVSPVAVSSALPGGSTSPNPATGNAALAMLPSSGLLSGGKTWLWIGLLAAAGVGVWLMFKD